MKFKKAAAAVLSVFTLGGMTGYGAPAVMDYPITAEAAGECYSFDSATGLLTLKGDVILDEIMNFEQKDAVKSIEAAEGTVFPESCRGLFADYVSCTSIELENADTSGTDNMAGMFSGCSALVSLDLSSFDTSSVENADNMFLDCYGLCRLRLGERFGDIAEGHCLPNVGWVNANDPFTIISGEKRYAELKNDGDNTYIAIGHVCGEALTWYYDADTKTLTVSGEGDMLDYSSDFPAPWNEYAEDIGKIVLPEKLTYIGENAFAYAENVSEVTIPASVTKVGTEAFASCYALRDVYIMGLDTVLDNKWIIYNRIGNTSDGYRPVFSGTIHGGVNSTAQKFAEDNGYKFETVICSVIWDPNGGSGTVVIYHQEELGSVYKIPECVFTPPENKIFDHWEIEGVVYEPGDTIVLEGDMTLVPIWKISDIRGDVNCDGSVNIADAVVLQRWLLAVPDTGLANWQNADICEDSRLDAFDMAMLRQLLTEND
ncbi:MAG: leucine-rich repeat protein [Ruminococcus sp.]|nr:leucine-rich repeat protein [Ruminococcus sp.]